MSDIENVYARAQEYANSVIELALAEAKNAEREELEKMYAGAVSLNAYYTRIEAKLSALPRLSYDVLRQSLRDIQAQELLSQAAMVEDQGGQLSNHVTVKTRPLLTLLDRCLQIVESISEEKARLDHTK